MDHVLDVRRMSVPIRFGGLGLYIGELAGTPPGAARRPSGAHVAPGAMSVWRVAAAPPSRRSVAADVSQMAPPAWLAAVRTVTGRRAHRDNANAPTPKSPGHAKRPRLAVDGYRAVTLVPAVIASGLRKTDRRGTDAVGVNDAAPGVAPGDADSDDEPLAAASPAGEEPDHVNSPTGWSFTIPATTAADADRRALPTPAAAAPSHAEDRHPGAAAAAATPLPAALRGHVVAMSEVTARRRFSWMATDLLTKKRMRMVRPFLAGFLSYARTRPAGQYHKSAAREGARRACGRARVEGHRGRSRPAAPSSPRAGGARSAGSADAPMPGRTRRHLLTHACGTTCDPFMAGAPLLGAFGYSEHAGGAAAGSNQGRGGGPGLLPTG